MSNRALLSAGLATVLAACADAPSPTGVSPSSPPSAIAIVSGDAQTATVGHMLSDPLVARVNDARGRPVRNAVVSFEVVGGGGKILGQTVVFTDSSGMASAMWQLGVSTAAEQTARARVSMSPSSTLDLQVAFHANALPDAAWSVGFMTPAGDPIEPASSFTRSVVARAYDFYGNPVPGAVVQWTGTGTLGADETITGAGGLTENEWTVRAVSSAVLGSGAYWITATIAGVLSGVLPSAVFTQLVGESRVAAVSLATGENHSCAVADAGEIYCWGDNASGQLGDGSGASRAIAVAVTSGESFTQVVAGAWHTCALTTSGKAYCWGVNGDGQLGDGTRASSTRPLAVEGGHVFVSLTAGRSHTCGLTDSGAAYCWGGNEDGQLGDGSTGRHTEPTAVVGEARFASLAAGAAHTCGLTSDGRTLCWGSDDAGQLGTTAPTVQCPVRCATAPVPADGNFVRLSAGADYTCALNAEGATSCWGGHLPARTEVGGGVRFTDIVGGLGDSACGITPDGRAFCWTFFYDDYYYYYSDDAQMSEPQLVSGDRVFSALRLGQSQTCGLERGTSGWIVCWSQRNAAAFILRAGRP